MGSRRHHGKLIADYHSSGVPGVSCATLVDEGPPRARIHDRHVWFILTEGKALVWCRGETQALSPGSVLMIEPGDVHRDIDKTPYRAVMVTALPERVHAMRGPCPTGFLGVTVAHSCAVMDDVVALVESARTGAPRPVQENLFACLVRSIAPFWTRDAPRPEPPLVARTRRALIESPRVGLSLDELAGHLGCAPTYLCRVFSDHMGLGPHAYQLHHRLLEARRLIEGGETVATAAALTGFGDESHLHRHFRRRFAVAPGRYRHEFVRGA